MPTNRLEFELTDRNDEVEIPLGEAMTYASVSYTATIGIIVHTSFAAYDERSKVTDYDINYIQTESIIAEVYDEEGKGVLILSLKEKDLPPDVLKEFKLSLTTKALEMARNSA